MRTARARLRPALALALLAWFAQLCLPVAHAAMMAAPHAKMSGWCGDPSRAFAAAAQLPAELREALGLDATGVADHLDDCAQLCALGSMPTAPGATCTVALRAAGLEPAPDAARPAPRPHEPTLTPPAQGPPAHA